MSIIKKSIQLYFFLLTNGDFRNIIYLDSISGKDVEENGIHDVGFRFHLVTYILCIGCGYAAGGVGWNAEPLRSIMITAISWGIGLLVHFVCFLVAQKNSIKGYAREEIFQ